MATQHQDVNGNHEFLDKSYDKDAALRKIQTAGSISISPELFEKLYLSPKDKVKGDLRQTFGNPTPIGIIGYVLALTPLSCDLLGWRGAGGHGSAEIGVYYGVGALLMLLAGLLEFFLGNTFPSVVFLTFGGFWFAYGSVLTPGFGAYAAYAKDPIANPIEGISEPAFLSSFAFFFLAMAMLSLVYLLASFRTNGVFVMIFFTLFMTFVFLAAAFWQLAQSNADAGAKLTLAGGSFAFLACLLGWYLFFVQMMAAVDMPLNLPVFDLSTFITGARERRKGGESAA